MVARAVYSFACINCGGEILDERLLKLGLCEKCLPDVGDIDFQQAIQILKSSGKLKKLKEISTLYTSYLEFKEFFRKAVGFEPWALQEVWAKRILLGENFAIVAPTGIGKTVLGLVMALYLASKGKRCYVIVPSSILAQQLYEKAERFAEKAGAKFVEIVAYHAGLSKSEKEEALKKISNPRSLLLITTDRFLVDRFESLKGNVFDYVFVDDVDSFLKSPKNIDRAVSLLGFNPEIVDHVLKLIELRRRIARGFDKDIVKEYERVEEIVEKEKRKRRGLLIVSGATLRGKRTKRLMIFRELLGFEVGRLPEFVRNIADLYMELEDRDLIDEAISLVKKHGPGCLIFVPQALGKDFAAKVAERFEKAGIKVHLYEKMEADILQRFCDEEIDAMVGIASLRSPLARGIDLPERIRYAVFIGVPRREITISRDEYNPTKILTLIYNIMPILERRLRDEAEAVAAKLSKIVPLNKELMEKIKNAIERGERLEGFEGYAENAIIAGREFLKKVLTDELIERIKRELDISIKPVEDGFSLIIPDTSGYIQASGRTSRLYAYGVTKGMSIVLVDDPKAFKGLTSRLKIILEELEFAPYDEKEAELIFREIDSERKIIRELRLGTAKIRVKDVIRSALMLVESPTKARTIAYLFGKPFRREVQGLTIYETSIGGVIVGVAATKGHLTDLIIGRGIHGVEVMDSRFIPIYGSIKRCLKCGEQWADGDSCPSCGSKEFIDKTQIVEAVRRLATQYNDIYLATDPDAEGEKIAYDLMCLIKPYNPRIYRLEFHEVTRRALLSAVENKRDVKLSLVEAQLLRRIEDRWIGFELSMKLWDRFKSRWLSAGRVQTPVLGWIVDITEKARKKRNLLRIRLKDGPIIELLDPENLDEIKKMWKDGKLRVKVMDVSYEERIINPLPPYTTDSYLRDASLYLKLSSMDAMRIAQELFEAGLITYHRTDSTTVSQTGINVAKSYLEQTFPEEFAPRTYRREGAHECIRPVRSLDSERLRYYMRMGIIRIPRKLSNLHFKVYDLIFRRFIASQMKSAKILTQRYVVDVVGNSVEVSNDVKIIEEGFMKVFPTTRMRKEVREGEYDVEDLSIRKIPAARLLSEGDVVAMMRERGIGRPSTYSKIIQTLFERGYIIERGGKLIATKKGKAVYSFLSQMFEKYISEELTRKLEEEMDMVERGEADYQELLRRLYDEVMEIKKTQITVS